MEELECDFLATGHYAEIKSLKNGKYGIFTSSDNLKDQTYFLFTIPTTLLPKLLFPVGGLPKPKVRAIAEEKNLPVFGKKDSTGICFVGSESYKKFIENQNPRFKKGALKLYPTGELLGEHTGIHQFTIGQRKGLSVSLNHPLFVIKINKDTGEVWLGKESHLYAKGAKLTDIHLLDDIQEGERLKVKIRFRHEGCLVEISKTEDSFYMQFIEPQKAVTPGQSAVFYRGRQLVGGGFITKSFSQKTETL